jgi:tRNA threonylcarbamoyladenosine biosynthesis protein TsaE
VLSRNLEDTLKVGEKIGEQLSGGEVIELVGDVGAGKTVFVRGVAKGAGSQDSVSSPSFTISRVYKCPNFNIHHFDFYRLTDPGIMKSDIEEVAGDSDAVVMVEWSDIVERVLPKNRLVVTISAIDENARKISILFPETGK